MKETVGLFFVVNGKLLLHECPRSAALRYGDFLNDPMSHDEVWRAKYQRLYQVDFDYYPRGRILYDCVRNVTRIFYDSCAVKEARKLAEEYEAVELMQDEHYQCHMCQKGYPDTV